MTLRNLNSGEFITYLETVFNRCRTESRSIPVDVVGEALIRLIEMESDLIEIHNMTEGYDYE